MRIIRTAPDLWTVNGVASFTSIDAAVEVALDVQAQLIKAAPVRTIWTVFK